MNRPKVLVLLLVVMLVIPQVSAGAQASDADDAAVAAFEVGERWFIVEFEAPSLARQAVTLDEGSGVIEAGKLDLDASASRAYVSLLQAQQAAFGDALRSTIPGVEVGRGYQIVLNAMAVKLPDVSVEAVKKLWAMPGVKRVSPQQVYTVDMDYSLPLIQASALWSQLGGREGAGKGVKIAVIDTGIDPDHPMFDGTGWVYPPTGGTWPKGYCADHAGFCNGKIIAARYYTPTMEVNIKEVLTPQDIDGHGSHTAGTAAGNVVTATYGTSSTQISGVAPGAWVMAYKGLFHTVDGTTATGSNIMLAGAIEDAIADGADVVNNSWGSSPIVLPANDPLVDAYEAAVDVGIVIVFSIGNAGSDYNTAGTPSSPKFISVGATTTQRAYYNTLEVTAPTPVTDTLQEFPATEMSDIDSSAIPTQTIGPLPYLPTGLTGELLTTSPETLPGGFVVPTVTVGITQTAPYSSGWIAVIPRGTYSFASKAANAKAQGAVAAVIYLPPNHPSYKDDDWKGGFTMQNEALYTVITGKVWGGGLVEWWEGHGDASRLKVGYPVSPFVTETEDVIAGFSSRGPQINLAIEPDVVAPGVNILSADPNGGYAVHGGTSMSAPHVVGSAALLLQQHPTWTPAQVKSALMTTAYRGVLDTDQATTADVMTQGSGRIDLSKAGDPGLTFDLPSHSFGMVPQGSSDSVQITASDVSGAAEVYDLSVRETFTDTGAVTVTVTPATLNVAGDGTSVFTITVEVGAGAMVQDLEGSVILSGTTHMAHIPYWLRVYEDTGAEVLLVDMDMSAWTLGTGSNPWGISMGDYLGYYAGTLDTMGVTYDVWDATPILGQDLPPRAILDVYDKVVIFTGDYFGILPYPGGGGWSLIAYDLSLVSDGIRSYLAAGGKMVVMGQDALGIDGLASYMRGADDDPLVDGVFQTMPPQPSLVGVESSNPFLRDVVLDLSTDGDGAGNQAWVDEVDWIDFVDLDTRPLFEVVNTVPGTVEDGYVATRSSYEPTIERVQDPIGVPQEPVSWRVTFFGFGLEGVNDDTGYATREDLLGAVFDWLDDDLSIMLEPTASSVGAWTTLEAEVDSSAPGVGFLNYRWDFGDGHPIVSTDGPTVDHAYRNEGTYEVTVEVYDSYGHKAVTTGTVLITPLGNATKTVDKDTAYVGDELSYEIVLENTTGTTATAMLTDVIPANTTYITHTMATYAGGQLTWTGKVAPGETVEITLKVRVNAGVAPGTVILNVAEIDAEGTPFRKKAETEVWTEVFMPLVLRSYGAP
jgi:uncharacterized repeat protein (TIGR01451 family)